MSDPEAYAVYTAHLVGARPARLIPPAPLLIQETTETWDGGPHCFPDTIKPEWQEVLGDYRRQNATRWTLERRLQLDMPYELVSRAAILMSFDAVQPGDWRVIDRAHPGSGGFTVLSAVGFGSDKTRAMLYSGRSCGGLCGAGGFYFFEKEERVWRRVTPMSPCSWIA
jgi:hypothetical protein